MKLLAVVFGLILSLTVNAQVIEFPGQGGGGTGDEKPPIGDGDIPGCTCTVGSDGGEICLDGVIPMDGMPGIGNCQNNTNSKVILQHFNQANPNNHYINFGEVYLKVPSFTLENTIARLELPQQCVANDSSKGVNAGVTFLRFRVKNDGVGALVTAVRLNFADGTSESVPLNMNHDVGGVIVEANAWSGLYVPSKGLRCITGIIVVGAAAGVGIIPMDQPQGPPEFAFGKATLTFWGMKRSGNHL